MSDVSDAAVAHVMLADYAAADATQKVNMLGTNWQVTGPNPETGLTPAHTVCVFIEVPSRFAGDNVAISIALTDATGDPVQLPGPGGEQQVLRVAQVVAISRPAIPNVVLPPELPSQVQLLLAFAQGLPLPGGRVYTWRLQLDGNTRPEWSATLYVAGPPPGVVVG